MLRSVEDVKIQYLVVDHWFKPFRAVKNMTILTEAYFLTGLKDDIQKKENLSVPPSSLEAYRIPLDSIKDTQPGLEDTVIRNMASELIEAQTLEELRYLRDSILVIRLPGTLLFSLSKVLCC